MTQRTPRTARQITAVALRREYHALCKKLALVKAKAHFCKEDYEAALQSTYNAIKRGDTKAALRHSHDVNAMDEALRYAQKVTNNGTVSMLESEIDHVVDTLLEYGVVIAASV